MMIKPRILITNDDGITAPGIRYLCNALKDIAELVIVAPHSEQSGVVMAITIRQPLRMHPFDIQEQVKAWSVTGTPADCVKMALSLLLTSPPDLVVSGINRGSNAGRNVLYSGTIAGTMEATLRGIPAIAFSCHDMENPDYAQAAQFVPKIVEYIVHHSLPKGTLLNVNFPPQELQTIKGIKLARQGKAYWMENPAKLEPTQEGYWLGVKLFECDEHEDSDIHWLGKGYATAVPVHVEELTDHRHFTEKKDHFENFFSH
jgi:5'-nucleotidase